MLPVLDILNHRPHTPIAWLRLADRVAFVCEPGFAGAAAGAEVFNNYGAKSNEELLLGFGFVLADPRNEHDTLSLVAAPFAAPAELAGEAAGPGGSDAGGGGGGGTGDAGGGGSGGGDDDEDEDGERAEDARSRQNLASLVGAAELPSRFVLRRAASSSAPAATGDVASASLPGELLMLMRAGGMCPLQLALAAGACRASASPRAAARALLSRGLSETAERRALEQLCGLLRRKLGVLEAAQPWLLHIGDTSASAGGADAGAGAGARWAATVAGAAGPGQLRGAGSALELPAPSAAPPCVSPAAAAADPQRAAYRRFMARAYVRGQHDILLDALSEVGALLDPARLAARRFALPDGACALELAPGAAGLPASAFEEDGLAGGGGGGEDDGDVAAFACSDCIADDEDGGEDEGEEEEEDEDEGVAGDGAAGGGVVGAEEDDGGHDAKRRRR